MGLSMMMMAVVVVLSMMMAGVVVMPKMAMIQMGSMPMAVVGLYFGPEITYFSKKSLLSYMLLSVFTITCTFIYAIVLDSI